MNKSSTIMTLNNDLVTIVIPVYNSSKYLTQSIESAINQTYGNIEIFVIDDGSTDDSLKILQQYSDKIKIITQSNQGLAAALNTAIRQINGKWFKWISPDDILYPNAIEILVNEAKQLEENTIVYSNWDLIDENNKKLGDFSESNYNDLEKFDFNVRLLDGQQINVNTTLIPTLLFEKGCSIQNIKDPIMIDYDFFLRAALLYDTAFHLIPKSLLKYRMHSSQLSHKNIVDSLKHLTEVQNQILSKLDDTKKQQYQNAIAEYNKTKPISKKTMEFGLKIISSTLPDWFTDKLIAFYLNKIRRTR